MGYPHVWKLPYGDLQYYLIGFNTVFACFGHLPVLRAFNPIYKMHLQPIITYIVAMAITVQFHIRVRGGTKKIAK